jgi:fatty-acyl-CoA synthase
VTSIPRHGGDDSVTPVTDCPNTSDYLLVRGAPGDVALVTPGGQCTYGELRAAASTLAAELAALELPPGSRVGILGPNSLFWVAAYLAVMKLGHVVVPFSDKLTADGIRPRSTRVPTLP